MTVKLAWTNRAIGGSINVYRSEATFDAASLPAVLASIAADATDYVDATVVAGTTYFYAVGIVDGGRIALSAVVEILAEASGGGGDPGPADPWVAVMNAAGWVLEADQTLLFSDTAGTTPITDTGFVAFASDKSANNDDAVQTTESRRPQFLAPNLLRFSGITALPPSTLMTAAFTIAVKVEVLRTTNTRAYAGAFASTSARMQLLTSSGQPRLFIGSNTSIQGGGSIIGAGTSVIVATSDGTTARLYLNGTQVSSGTYSGGPPLALAPWLGATNNSGSPSDPIDADISKALFLQRELTAAEVATLV